MSLTARDGFNWYLHMKKKRSKKGQTKYNKQWRAEHKRHRDRLWHGDIDKLTGESIK